jgi:hypothetical protein
MAQGDRQDPPSGHRPRWPACSTWASGSEAPAVLIEIGDPQPRPLRRVNATTRSTVRRPRHRPPQGQRHQRPGRVDP